MLAGNVMGMRKRKCSIFYDNAGLEKKKEICRNFYVESEKMRTRDRKDLEVTIC